MELFAESSRDLPDHENHDDHTQGKNKTQKKAALAKKAHNKHQSQHRKDSDADSQHSGRNGTLRTPHHIKVTRIDIARGGHKHHKDGKNHHNYDGSQETLARHERVGSSYSRDSLNEDFTNSRNSRNSLHRLDNGDNKHLNVKINQKTQAYNGVKVQRLTHHHDPKNSIDACVQTDQELLLAYIINFLHQLETNIRDGFITAEDVESINSKTDVRMGHFEIHKIEIPNRKKLLEMQQLLMKIRSFRTGGGDNFFVTLARIFFART